MYFRTKTVKNTFLLQLVESYRNAEGLPRQRVEHHLPPHCGMRTRPN